MIVRRCCVGILAIVLLIGLFPANAFALTAQEQENIHRVDVWWQDEHNQQFIDWLMNSDNFVYHLDVTTGGVIHDISYASLNLSEKERKDNFVKILSSFIGLSFDKIREQSAGEAFSKISSIFLKEFEDHLKKVGTFTVEEFKYIEQAISVTSDYYLSHYYGIDTNMGEYGYNAIYERIQSAFDNNVQDFDWPDHKAEVMDEFYTFVQSNEWYDKLKSHSKIFKSIVSTVDLAQDGLALVGELESYRIADKKLVELLKHIASNSTDSALTDACNEIISKFENTYEDNLINGILEIAEDKTIKWAYDKVKDFIAEKCGIYGVFAKIGIEAGKAISDLWFNTSDIKQHMQSVYCVNLISELLVDVLETELGNQSIYDHQNAYTAEYAANTIYHMRVLIELRKTGEMCYYNLKNSAYNSAIVDVCKTFGWFNKKEEQEIIEAWYSEFQSVISGVQGSLYKMIPLYHYYDEAQANEPNASEKWEGYTPISSKEELNSIRENLNGKYYLTNDIVFTSADFASGGPYYNGGNGWKPIGTKDEPFTGILDGNGYSILGIYVYVPISYTGGFSNPSYAGVFGYGVGAIFKNLTMGGGTVHAKTDSSKGSWYAGGLVAYCVDTLFINCHNSNTVKGSYCGGIAGSCTGGAISNCTNGGMINQSLAAHSCGGIVGEADKCTISNCHNYGAIGDNWNILFAGGIVGDSDTGEMIIEYCSNYGMIGYDDSVDGVLGAGGIIGGSSCDTIRYCYNIGSVIGMRSGGILGDISSYGGETSCIYDCFNRGSITGLSERYVYAGGICGYGGSIRNCYNTGGVYTNAASKETRRAGIAARPDSMTNCYAKSGQTFTYTDGAILCSTADMKLQSTYENYDFDTVWGISATVNNGYPYLKQVLSEKTVENPVLKLNSDMVNMTIRKGTSANADVKMESNGQLVLSTMLQEGFDFLVTVSDKRIIRVSEVVQTTSGVQFVIEGISDGEAILRVHERNTGAIYDARITVESGNTCSYTGKITTAATCTTDGVKTFTCSCGDSYTEVIPATGHNYVGGKCVCGDTKTVSINGSFNDGGSANMTWTKNGYIYSVELTSGTHQFNVVKDGVSLGNDGDIWDTTTATSDTGWEFTEWRGDCNIVATGGFYHFTFLFDTNRLIVTYDHAHQYTAGEVVAPTCTANGYTVYTCGICGDSYYDDEVDALGHAWTDATYTAPKTCSICGETEGEALGHEAYTYSFDRVNNIHNFTCVACGETVTKAATDGQKFAFNTAAPTLSVDIVMNIAVTLPAGFENPYMVVEFNGVTTTLNDYTINAENGRYVFAFPGINPQVMGDTFCATLYAYVDGVQVTVELEYSMLKYINSQLKKTTTPAELRTALSDLVMYGEANQIYEGYKTDALLSTLLDASATLTPSTFVNLDSSYNQMAITGTHDANIDLKGASLSLGSRVLVRVTVFCADAQTHSVKATINGESFLYPVSELALADGYTGRYVLEFDQIRATQFGEVITVTFLNGEGATVGRTLNYSVYTYIQRNQNTTNENLANLLKAIYNYGESVKKI